MDFCKTIAAASFFLVIGINSAFADLREIDCNQFAVVGGDANPVSNCPASFFSKTSNKGWDYENRSIVADLASVKLIDEVRLIATGKTASMPNVDSVELYTSLDNRIYTKVEDAKFELLKDADGQINWIGKFSGFKKYARFVKAHNNYSGTATGFCSKTDCADMIKIFSSVADTAVPIILNCLYPKYVERTKLPIEVILSDKPGQNCTLRIVLEGQNNSFSKSFQFSGIQQKNSFVLDINKVPVGKFRVAVFMQLDGADAGRWAGDLRIAKKIWTSIPDLKSLDANEIILVRDTRKYSEGQAGHLEARVYELPWGEKGVLSRCLNPQSDGFVINWPVRGTYVLTAGVTAQSEMIKVQFGSTSPELVKFLSAKGAPKNDELHEVYLGKFTISSDFMRIRVSLSYGGKLGYLRFEPYVGPAWSGIEQNRRVLVDIDGFSVFYMGMMQDANEMNEYISRYSNTDVRSVIWCVNNYMEVNYKSRYAPLLFEDNICPRSGDKLIRKAVNSYIANGKDTLDCMLDTCRQYDLECLVSIRMNWAPNVAYDKNRRVALYEKFKPYFVYDSPDHKSAYPSYAYDEVRKQVLNIVSEIAYKGPDGILLEFTRSPPFVGYEPVLLEKYKQATGSALDYNQSSKDDTWLKIKSQPLTDLMTKVRAICDENSKRTGKKMKVAVHVANVDLLSTGIDIDAWASKGLIDTIIFGDGASESRICDAVQNIKSIEKFGCINAHYGGHDPTPEEDAAEKAGKKIKREMKWLDADNYYHKMFNLYNNGFDGVCVWDAWMNLGVITRIGDMNRVYEKCAYEKESASTIQEIKIR